VKISIIKWYKVFINCHNYESLKEFDYDFCVLTIGGQPFSQAGQNLGQKKSAVQFFAILTHI